MGIIFSSLHHQGSSEVEDVHLRVTAFTRFAATHESCHPCYQTNCVDDQKLLLLLFSYSAVSVKANQNQPKLLVPIYSSYDATSHWAVISIGNPPILLRLLIVVE